MQLGRLGSIVAACAGLGAAGAGMIWPNNVTIGWALIAIGILVAVGSIIYFFWAGRVPTKPRKPEVEGDLGGISLIIGDKNKVGDVGHKLTRTNQPNG